MLSGLKTYAIAGIAILAALLGFFSQTITATQAAEAIGLALGLGGNRAVLQVIAPLSRDGWNKVLASRAVTYVGVALTILSAIYAGLQGHQEPAAVIAAVLSALGLNFLGIGAKKAVVGDATHI